MPEGNSFVNDPEELAQTQRLRGLLERRDNLIDSIQASTISKTGTEREEREAKTMLVASLQSLVLDLYPLLLLGGDSSEINVEGQEYLEDKEIGEFVVTPPPEAPQSIGRQDLAQYEQPAESKAIEVTGLEWFINNRIPFKVTWEIDSLETTDSKSYSKTVLPPIRLCVKATKVCIKAMNELGIDAKVYDDKGVMGFSYDDIQQDTNLDIDT